MLQMNDSSEGEERCLDLYAVETWIDNSEIFIFNKSIRTLHKSNFSTIDSLVNYQISELLVSEIR